MLKRILIFIGNLRDEYTSLFHEGENLRKMCAVIIIASLINLCFMGISGEGFEDVVSHFYDSRTRGGPTNVSGIIFENTTWKLANSPYIVTGHILVEDNVNLTIDPGVVVKFYGEKSMRVDGILYAHGTESKMITFTLLINSSSRRYETNHWDGIKLESTSNGSTFKYFKCPYSS